MYVAACMQAGTLAADWLQGQDKMENISQIIKEMLFHIFLKRFWLL